MCVMTIARLGLKVKVIGQSQRLVSNCRNAVGRSDLDPLVLD